ncbi:MAG: hypothetical protein N2C12_11525, partial [Planctomycetales bacterium]
IQIRRSELAEATSANVFDTLTVQVTASAIDYRVSIDTGKYLSGSRSPDDFTEFWSFVRRKGVQTNTDKAGLIEGYCPNCGDSIRLNQVEKCGSCEALLRSGEHDWVLTEITQACEWRPRSIQEQETACSYRNSSDPGFNIQHLEDRASVVFWRKAMADRLADIKPLMKVATDEFCQGLGTQFAKYATGSQREYCGGCAVGSVNLMGIVEEEQCDFPLVEIRWAANAHAINSDGGVRDLGRWRRYRSLYVLMRRKGVQTNIQRTIDSAHCPGCGAPESDLASHACEFCEAVLNNGRHDWVLCECHSTGSQPAREWLAKLETTVHEATSTEIPSAANTAAAKRQAMVSHADVLAWMVNVFAADKTIEDRERKAIQQLAQKQHMPEPVVEGLLKSALDGELDAPSPPDLRTGRVWMEELADVALLDGKVDSSERQTLLQLGKQIGLSKAEVNLLINKRRADRYRKAKA